MEQEELCKVIPKLECFRQPARYKLTYGGRGSGKSTSIASLLVQEAQLKPLKIFCTREIQYSLEESVYALLEETVARLRYPNWKFTDKSIRAPNGSKFFFRGLKDMRAANALKSTQGIDRVWIEEAETVSAESLRKLVPTIRKDGSEIWASWNPETVSDPISEYLDKPRALCVTANHYDNPWFTIELQKEMEYDYKKNYDEAIHTWEGMPRKQGINSVMSRVDVTKAMKRNIESPEGREEIGVDVARYGGDTTQIYKRHGLKIVAHEELRSADTIAVSNKAFGMRKDNETIFKIDGGYNPGVIDEIRHRGGVVVEIDFGGSATDKNKYGNCVSEMWFEFPIAEADIPDDKELLLQLTDRRYSYDNKDRKIVESKDQYKKRNSGKSPDKADALLLAYFQGKNSQWNDHVLDQLKSIRG